MRIFLSFFLLLLFTSKLQAKEIQLNCGFVENDGKMLIIINQELETLDLIINNQKPHSLAIIDANSHFVKARASTIIFSYQRKAKTFVIALATRNNNDELGAEYFTGSCS